MHLNHQSQKEADGVEEEQKYFYQQDPTSAVISWSWTFLILIAGVVVWLEVTHFQWLSAFLLGLAILIGVLAISRRTLTVTKNEMIFNRLLQRHFLVVPIKEIRQPRFTRHTMSITVRGQVMTFTFSRRALVSLRALLRDAADHGQLNRG